LNKKHQISSLVDCYLPDILALQETKLSESIRDSELGLSSNYTIYRRDRNARGGGILLAINNSFRSCLLHVDKDFEFLICRVSISVNFEMILVLCYRPPNYSDNFFQAVDSKLNSLFPNENFGSNRSLILLGDLNLPGMQWDTHDFPTPCPYSSQVYEDALLLTDKFLLTQVVDQPTRGDNLLDVILIRDPDLLLKIRVENGISDHKLLTAEFNFVSRLKSANSSTLNIFDFNKANIDGINDFLKKNFLSFSARSNSMDIEDMWVLFKNLTSEAIRSFVPQKQICPSSSRPVWFGKQLRSLERRMKRAFRNRNLSSAHRQQYIKLRNEFSSLKTETESDFIASLSNKGKNNKCLWRFVRHLNKVGDMPSLVSGDGSIKETDLEKADCLNEQYVSVFSPASNQELNNYVTNNFDVNDLLGLFSKSKIIRWIKKMPSSQSKTPDEIPFTVFKLAPELFASYLELIFLRSFSSGALPLIWKQAFVIPIFKKGSRDDPSNYRPVSLTSCCCKLMEHLITDYIRDFLNQNNILFSGQHGFRPLFSCDSQLATLIQYLSSILDSKGQADVIFLDFSKAFDIVPHDKLVQKLINLGLPDPIIAWIASFLSNRSQRVRVGEAYSDPSKVTSGVPQGSVLGPLLFLIYINDIANGIKSEVRLFADDCALSRVIINTNSCEDLQADLNRISSWCRTWGMKLNSLKCSVVSFSHKKNITSFPYSINDTPLSVDDFYNYLGILLKSDLNWDKHVASIAQKANFSLSSIRRNFKSSPKEVKELLYFSLVRSLVEYSSTSWDPYKIGQVEKLERIQRRAARFVTSNYNRNDSVTDMLASLKWPSLASRRRTARLVNFYRVYNQIGGWADLNKYLLEPTYFSRHDHQYKVRCSPPSKDVGKYSFMYRTANDWNQLDPSVLNPFPRTAIEFKRRLK